MKYEEIERLSSKQIDDIRYKTGKSSDESIKEILNFYKPQIQKLVNDYNSKVMNNHDIINLEFTIDRSLYNQNPYVLSKSISLPGWFIFQLSEMHNNCGILVSTNTNIVYRNFGFGTLLHAIKEDIAYLAQYSYLMYTDVNSPYHINSKLLNTIPGITKIFEGHNSRSANNIGIWIKDINEWYKKEKKVDLKQETTETLTLTDF